MSDTQLPGPPGSDRPPLQALEALMTQPFSQLAKVSEILPINWDELAKPPFFVPSRFTKSDMYRGSMAYSIIQMQWRAQRKLTPEEAQIVAMQKSKYLYTVSYALPLIFGTAAAYTVHGRDVFRFPFFTPGEKFRSNVFPTKNRAWLRGLHARIMWHSCRFAAYLAISQWAISSFVVSYALTVRQAEFDRDPRLNSLRSSIRHAATERMAHSKNPRTRMLAEKVQQSDPVRGAQAPEQSALRSPRQPLQDDASPQDQQFQSDQQLEDERYQKEQQQYQQQYQPTYQQRYPSQYQQPQTGASAQRTAPLPWQKKRDEDDGGLGLDDYYYDDNTVPDHDDASPVAPAKPRSKWQKPGSTAGSSWDRLRKDATSPGQAQEDERDVPAQGSKWSRVRASASPDADRGGKTAGDYMYDLRDEDKALAKDKAQRDFDALLDKERQGENDADSRRKW